MISCHVIELSCVSSRAKLLCQSQDGRRHVDPCRSPRDAAGGPGERPADMCPWVSVHSFAWGRGAAAAGWAVMVWGGKTQIGATGSVPPRPAATPAHPPSADASCDAACCMCAQAFQVPGRPCGLRVPSARRLPTRLQPQRMQHRAAEPRPAVGCHLSDESIHHHHVSSAGHQHGPPACLCVRVHVRVCVFANALGWGRAVKAGARGHPPPPRHPQPPAA